MASAAPTATPQRVVMVTGGTGLVGSAIKAYVESLGPNPNERWIFLDAVDGDLRQMSVTRGLFERHHPTHVIHLAARVGGLFDNMRDKVGFWRDNIMINDTVLQCAHDFHVQKCVSCLSTCVFPDKTTYPIDETMLHNGPPHFSNEGYAYSKRMVEMLNRLYHEQFGDNFTAVIPTNIFGPNDNYYIEGGHVIPGLIHKCYLAKKNHTDFVIWGDGSPLRQFIYSMDMAKLFHWVLYNYSDPSPVILSVDETDEVSIGDVAREVARAMHFEGNIVFDTTKANGQFRKTASNAKLRRLLPDFHFTPLRDAIQASVDWFVANYDRARK
ncbi:putative GDP-L-fucose synthase [Paratrimastix pyriformis]|uniref:GDP-L-fucose synthase n=1 Tax=Paratrimastix pyriformis TaxID=342808 RepID=A0ABQ8U7X3_9EUKA|nr:putative GDP-L-fucose synthase [Paratrimastix pyriformis]